MLLPVAQHAWRTVDAVAGSVEPELMMRSGTDDAGAVGELLQVAGDVDLLAYAALTLTADGDELSPDERVVRTFLDAPSTARLSLPELLVELRRKAAHDRLRAEAAALAADDGDRAEAAEVLRDMESLRAW
ncbi:hypothetical protein [Blastococcus tunisiensis]|uniref:Uncharacterized protein n=1 Tax=Blastococcus tunisiensis TaxID=1798228 RepID=A0A1I1ZMI0_9ACTN|nr:hypothetical protein [Blastococcus sp. DSM 46838]SFE32558.1 hypothetical protein SAMN05216574_10394 [Blastococcus sp. DSM 46838]